MNIKVNGKAISTQAANVAALIDELALPHNGTAVAIDNRLVTRSQWDSRSLAEGMSLVVIRAAAGG